MNPEKLQQMFNVVRADTLNKIETEIAICQRNLNPDEEHPLTENRKKFLDGQLSRLQSIKSFVEMC